MALHLCLILLATSVLDREYGGRSRETGLYKHFHLSQEGSQSIRLRWEVRILPDLKGTTISLTVLHTSDPSVLKRQSAQFPDKLLTLCGLKTSTLCKITVEAVIAIKIIPGFTEDIETPRTRKLLRSPLMTSESALTSPIALYFSAA
ncbi:EG95 [Echinococcus multilocularis]|uniref:EG95 n=1 Tax=Echinococcus multilocularis TaxID=6211 RepID=A0A068XXS6_ECHMU|nr:EG95 [Echinococcus multilocularis]